MNFLQKYRNIKNFLLEKKIFYKDTFDYNQDKHGLFSKISFPILSIVTGIKKMTINGIIFALLPFIFEYTPLSEYEEEPYVS